MTIKNFTMHNHMAEFVNAYARVTWKHLDDLRDLADEIRDFAEGGGKIPHRAEKLLEELYGEDWNE